MAPTAICFPEPELARYGDPSPDIEGLTEYDHVLGSAADWTSVGSSSIVFPGRFDRIIESPTLLDNLFI